MTKPLPTVTPTSLRAITGWTILANVFIYAWAYYISKDAVGKIATQHKAGLADLEAWLFVAQAVGALAVGIIVDSIGTRAAINLTHLGSLTIYVGATILQMDAAEQRRLGFKPELLASLPFAVRAATALQHTMMATQIAVCVGAWRSQAKTFILLIVVNLFYQAGSLCAGPLRSWLPTVAERETTAAAAALTACAFVWNFFITFPSTTITRRALQVNGGTQLVTLRPPRAALPTIIFRTLPALALVVALRLGRLVVMEFRSSMSPSASPLGGFIPASVPVDTALQITSYFVVLILALFSNGPGAFALLVPGVLVFTRAATVFDPAAVARQVDVFYVALGLLCGVLYMLPNAIVGTAASPGQKGRAMGLAAAASVFVFQYNAQLRAWVLQTVKIYAPRFTALSLSASELDFVVTGLLFSLALILAPFVIRTADATDASFRAVNGKTFKEVSAEPAQRAAADSAAAGRTASPTGNSGLKHRKAH